MQTDNNNKMAKRNNKYAVRRVIEAEKLKLKSTNSTKKGEKTVKIFQIFALI